MARELGDHRLEADRLSTLASIQDRLGQHRTAIDNYRQAHEIAKDYGFRHAEAEALIGAATVYLHLADHGQAHAYLTQAIDIADREGYQLLKRKATAALAESTASPTDRPRPRQNPLLKP